MPPRSAETRKIYRFLCNVKSVKICRLVRKYTTLFETGEWRGRRGARKFDNGAKLEHRQRYSCLFPAPAPVRQRHCQPTPFRTRAYRPQQPIFVRRYQTILWTPWPVNRTLLRALSVVRQKIQRTSLPSLFTFHLQFLYMYTHCSCIHRRKKRHRSRA